MSAKPWAASATKSHRLPRFPVYTDLSQFDIVHQVGEGTYGKVFKATHRTSGQLVALKKIFLKEDDKGKEKNKSGFPITTIREIEILRAIRHPNIVDLQGMISFSAGQDDLSMYMVFEYMDHDMTGILQHGAVHYDAPQIKCLARQLFDGLAYLHSKSIIHRDVKGANLLLNSRGELKLADFGLARRMQFDRVTSEPLLQFEYTNRVVTLWYRAPELLLGSTLYGFQVDLWSAGCIIVELFSKAAIFQGRTEIEQLEAIFRVCGTPTVDVWPDITSLSWYGLLHFDPTPRRVEATLRKYGMSAQALRLVDSLLMLDPAKRPTAAQALAHPYFTTEAPHACDPWQLPKIEGDWHEFESKQRKRGKAGLASISQPGTSIHLSPAWSILARFSPR
ncbi:kinase-like domain-containing protein [Entophlyctis helioformis]|nr:kinase-like domain-containing protein [Entophlyctis helioformis]